MQNLPFLLIAGLMLCTFFTISFASQKFRLPSVLIYIVLGALVSSLFFKNELIHIVAEIGIVLLFFILGLEFPLARMITISKRVWPAGFLDVAVNLGGAMTVAMLFGLDVVTAFIIGSVAYATSSSISAKMLGEKKRLANPEAEFILALLIFEDLVAPILVSFIAGIYGGKALSMTFMGILSFKIVILMAGAILMGHYGFKQMKHFIARYIENDFMPLLAAGLALAYAGSRWFGLSPKVACRAAFSMVHRGEFSAIIAGMALPQLRIFSGVYILITAFIGVYLFGRASDIANWYQDKWSSGFSPN